MKRADLLEALADAEKAIAESELWGFGPDGFGPIPHPAPPPPDPRPLSRWTGKPRRGSKEWRRKHGGIV